MPDCTEVGIDPVCKVIGANMCSPVLQARKLAKAGTELNIVVGLCVGHDPLLYKHSQSLTTTLIVKDRGTGHIPLSRGDLLPRVWRRLSILLALTSTGGCKGSKSGGSVLEMSVFTERDNLSAVIERVKTMDVNVLLLGLFIAFGASIIENGSNFNGAYFNWTNASIPLSGSPLFTTARYPYESERNKRTAPPLAA